MSGHTIELKERKVWVLEEGHGAPLLYLHGFADVHGVTEDFMPFQQALGRGARVIAPAHPGCARSDDNDNIDDIDDVVFHYLEVIDVLGLHQFHLAGACAGGWIAAEIAVRHPEKVRSLVLLGATGLLVPGFPIGDVFMMSQPEGGVSLACLRKMLFSREDHPRALELFPDGRGPIENEVRRYQMLRFTSQFGFKPPYLYNWKLDRRLHRIQAPCLIIWGEVDRMVPPLHGRAYAERIPNAKGPEIVQGAGHAVQVEQPEESARLLLEFLKRQNA